MFTSNFVTVTMDACRFVYDILHGIDIVTAAFAKNASALASHQPLPGDTVKEVSPTPEILVHLTNSGIVLPASSQ